MARPTTKPDDAPVAELSSKRLVLLPTLNEEEGLEATLRDIGAVDFSTRSTRPTVALLDGQSTDGTLDVAKAWGLPVVEQRGRGKGRAVRQGLDWAVGQGFASVAVMDADATYPASALPALFQLLETGRDMAIGVRRPDPGPLRSTRDIIHRLGNGLFNFAATQFSGSPVLDVCSGFWGIRTSVVDGLQLESDGFEIESELFLKTFRSGLRVAQFPIEYRTRLGQPKLHAGPDGIRILLSILRHAPRRGRPYPLVRPPLAERLHHDLLGLLFALDPARVIFLSEPARRVEAETIARSFATAFPQAEVTVVTRSPAVRIPEDDTYSGLTSVWGDARVPIVVALPESGGAPAEQREFLLGLPRSHRVVRINIAPPQARPKRKPSENALPSFRRERHLGSGFASLLILAAVLGPSEDRRELAMLGASTGDSSITVYRQAASRGTRELRVVLPPVSPFPGSLDGGGM